MLNRDVSGLLCSQDRSSVTDSVTPREPSPGAGSRLGRTRPGAAAAWRPRGQRQRGVRTIGAAAVAAASSPRSPAPTVGRLASPRRPPQRRHPPRRLGRSPPRGPPTIPAAANREARDAATTPWTACSGLCGRRRASSSREPRERVGARARRKQVGARAQSASERAGARALTARARTALARTARARRSTSAHRASARRLESLGPLLGGPDGESACTYPHMVETRDPRASRLESRSMRGVDHWEPPDPANIKWEPLLGNRLT